MLALKKQTGISYQWSRWLKLFLVTLGMTLLVKFGYQVCLLLGLISHLATLVAIIIGVGTYGLALLAIGELDVKNLRRMLRMG
jgi:hypothetical protein